MLRGNNTKHETFLLNSRKKCSPVSQKWLGVFCNWGRNGNQGQIYKVFTKSWQYSSVCVSQRYYSSLKLKFSQNRSSGVLSHNQSAALSTSPESAQASVYSSGQRQHNQFLTSRQNNSLILGDVDNSAGYCATQPGLEGTAWKWLSQKDCSWFSSCS